MSGARDQVEQSRGPGVEWHVLEPSRPDSGARQRPAPRRTPPARRARHPPRLPGVAHVAELDHRRRHVGEVEGAEVAADVEPVAAGDVVGPGEPLGPQRGARRRGRAAARRRRCRGSSERRSAGAITWKPRAPGAREPSAWMLSLRSAPTWLPARPRASTHGPHSRWLLARRVSTHPRAERLEPPLHHPGDLPDEGRLRVAAVGGRAGGVARLAEAAGRHQSVDLAREVVVAELVTRVEHDDPAGEGRCGRRAGVRARTGRRRRCASTAWPPAP